MGGFWPPSWSPKNKSELLFSKVASKRRPGGVPEAPKNAQERSKSVPRAPKSAPRVPKSARKARKSDPLTAKTCPWGAQGAIRGIFGCREGVNPFPGIEFKSLPFQGRSELQHLRDLLGFVSILTILTIGLK